MRSFREMRPEWALVAISALESALSASVFPISSMLIALLISLMIEPDAELQPGPMAGANLYSLLLFIVAIVALIGMTAQIAGFEIAGFAITFPYNWILTLIMTGTLPFLVFGAAYETKIELNFVVETQKDGIHSGEGHHYIDARIY
ncbi:hypothetical protein BJV82DRAFT_702108 [Fennellomyces sp. T-0311]|nr:hypothetical protein BJV82DRAFT_702108 [Fennellomyces sp. T-0311]